MTVELYDVKKGEVVHTLDVHEAAMQFGAFFEVGSAPNGRNRHQLYRVLCVKCDEMGSYATLYVEEHEVAHDANFDGRYLDRNAVHALVIDQLRKEGKITP